MQTQTVVMQDNTRTVIIYDGYDLGYNECCDAKQDSTLKSSKRHDKSLQLDQGASSAMAIAGRGEAECLRRSGRIIVMLVSPGVTTSSSSSDSSSGNEDDSSGVDISVPHQQ